MNNNVKVLIVAIIMLLTIVLIMRCINNLAIQKPEVKYKVTYVVFYHNYPDTITTDVYFDDYREVPEVIVNSGSNYITGCTEQCRYLAPLKILSYERYPQPINNKQ